jgi:hypothetical protein
MSDGTKSRKYKTYNALQLLLSRSGIEKSGAVATLLLETFVEDGGRLPASKVVARGICEEGKFVSWREGMIRSGWLVWSQTQADKGQYFVGKKLARYVNKAKEETKEFVTRDEVLHKSQAASKAEVSELRDDVQDLKAQVHEIQTLLVELKRLQAPPPTAAAQMRSAEIVEKLDALMKNNLV